jgi:hypothetical protein
MTILRTVLCLVAGAGLLGACSKPAATSQAAAGSAAASSASGASSGPDVTITETDLPHLKPGLWSTTVTSSAEGGKPDTSTHCETGQTIKPVSMGKVCSRFSFKRTFLGAIVIDAACGRNGVTTTMHMDIHGDYNSAITGDSQVSLTLPGQGTQSFTTHTESHYVGPCPAGGGDG